MAQSAVRNFEHRKGMNPLDYILIQDGDGVAIDISAWTFTLNVRRSHRPNSTLEETFTDANGKIVIHGVTTGRLDFALDGTEFSTTTIKGVKMDFVYDLEGTDASSVVYPVLKGNWTVFSNL